MENTSVFRSFDDQLIDLNGKVIFVTGGTGSFGKAFVRNVIERYTPKKLIVFSRDELKQYEMSQEWPMERYDFMRYFIGDVRDYSRLEMAMREVDIVVHAAALKQVPAAEYNPFECINTNVIGAENIVRAAIHCNVEKVLALSTDKASNPVNLYGASKLAADKIFAAANNLRGDRKTVFSVVRYGNVLGSRGSVIPFFRKLISEGADRLPITDPEMARFWITIDQGVSFVLSCLSMMGGSEIFVPKIPSMKITDLAEAVAPDLPHEVIGIRAGEKIHEILVTDHDAYKTYDLGDRYVIGPSFEWWDDAQILAQGGVKVPKGFEYSSDNNKEWLDVGSLKKWLENN